MNTPNPDNLAPYTDEQLAQELARRFRVHDSLKAQVAGLFGASTAPAPEVVTWRTKSPRGFALMSRRKQEWWDEKRLRAATLGVTVGQLLKQERDAKARVS